MPSVVFLPKRCELLLNLISLTSMCYSSYSFFEFQSFGSTLHRWPHLVPTLIATLQQADVLRMYNALLALRKLVKRFEYKANSDRQPLLDTLQYCFPHLQALFTAILHNNSVEAAQVMRLCLKIFWSSTVYQLPKISGVDVNLWFHFVAEIMNKRLYEASENIEPLGQPADKDERKNWPWWKVSLCFYFTFFICDLLI